VKEDGRSARGGGRCDYKGLTIAGNAVPCKKQGDALCGRGRRAGSASGVDRHYAAGIDVVAIVYLQGVPCVAAEGRRVEVEGVVYNVHGDASPLEREEREERGGSREAGVS